jgi:hypothetical protein
MASVKKTITINAPVKRIFDYINRPIRLTPFFRPMIPFFVSRPRWIAAWAIYPRTTIATSTVRTGRIACRVRFLDESDPGPSGMAVSSGGLVVCSAHLGASTAMNRLLRACVRRMPPNEFAV